MKQSTFPPPDGVSIEVSVKAEAAYIDSDRPELFSVTVPVSSSQDCMIRLLLGQLAFKALRISV